MKARIEKICSLITPAKTLADIGCDHGKVSEYIVRRGLAETLIVNDISSASLQKAQTRLSRIPHQTAVVYACCDGAQLTAHPIDCAVIAGFGGRTLLRIIQSLLPPAAVLAPQNFQDGLRRGITELGYTIQTDCLVTDNKKPYQILRIARITDNG
ncbi:MAG: class I SAM-dependent methyltransferase [Firmicutes bacterium]|nr:class I SAM-dependent methyltransferase [Bacillota bacterium]